MAIVIKEIEVKTIIEREFSPHAIDESLVNRIKEDVYRELKDEWQREVRKRKER